MGTNISVCMCVCMSAVCVCVCVCVCVYMCVVEGKTSKYTDLQSLQVSGLLNSFTVLHLIGGSLY